MLAEKEFDQVIVKYRGAGGNRSHSAPRLLLLSVPTRAGVQITRIEDVTPIPTNGTKAKGAEEAVGSEVIMMVKIEVLDMGPENAKLLLKDCDRAFANALRRTLMSDTPKDGYRDRSIPNGVIRFVFVMRSSKSSWCSS